MSSKHASRPNTQKAIVEAAIQLLNNDAGASMSEIALAAGVGRATLHRHFANREALISEIQLTCIEQMNAAVEAQIADAQSAAEQLQGLFAAAIPIGDRFNFLNLEADADPEVKRAYSAQLQRLFDLVSRLKTEGTLDENVPDHWVIAQIDQLVWTAWREVSAGRLAALEAPALALRTLLRGLAV